MSLEDCRFKMSWSQLFVNNSELNIFKYLKKRFLFYFTYCSKSRQVGHISITNTNLASQNTTTKNIKVANLTTQKSPIGDFLSNFNFGSAKK